MARTDTCHRVKPGSASRNQARVPRWSMLATDIAIIVGFAYQFYYKQRPFARRDIARPPRFPVYINHVGRAPGEPLPVCPQKTAPELVWTSETRRYRNARSQLQSQSDADR
jgi:hypothetical protein